MLQKAVQEHQASLDPDHPRDFIDIYINHINNNNTDESNFSGV